MWRIQFLAHRQFLSSKSKSANIFEFILSSLWDSQIIFDLLFSFDQRWFSHIKILFWQARSSYFLSRELTFGLKFFKFPKKQMVSYFEILNIEYLMLMKTEAPLSVHAERSGICRVHLFKSSLAKTATH